jgi:ParB family chromosome partitioning protein
MNVDSKTIAVTDEQIPFADLYLSDLNPRSIVNDETIELLAANIRKLGLIQNPAGLRDADGKVAIVAGGRRYRALAMLQDEERFQTVTVRMAPDQATAEFWATSENAQREDLHPADEIRDFGMMNERGVKVTDIAVAYGVTEKHVYRRLALSNLPAPVLDALKAGTVSLSHAAAFTVSNDEALTLEVLASHLERVAQGWGGLSEHMIKSRLKPNNVKGTDRRAVFVGLDDFKAAGGHVGADLFEDVTTFDDPAIMDEVFAAKLTQTANDYPAAHGWKWAEATTEAYIGYDFAKSQNFGKLYAIEGELTEAEAERWDELAELADAEALDEEGTAEMDALQKKMDGDFTAEQRALSGVVLFVATNGTVSLERGFIRSEDMAAAVEAGFVEPSRHAEANATPKPAISETLGRDLDRISTGARQNAMLDDPKLALHLLAFQLCGKMGYDTAFGLRKDEVSNVPTAETGYVLDKRLTVADADDRRPFDRDHAAEFAKFRKRGDAKIMDLLNRYLVSQLSIRNADLGAMIDKLTAKRTRDTFTPTAENFFGRMKGDYLNDLWSDLLGLAADHPTVTTFDKLKKGEKALRLESLFADPATRTALGLSEDQTYRINAWLPEGMA